MSYLLIQKGENEKAVIKPLERPSELTKQLSVSIQQENLTEVRLIIKERPLAK